METEAAPEHVTFSFNVQFKALAARENIVFFGRNLGLNCRRCGAYERTSLGHTYCAQSMCPIALIEVKRRRRKRTSSLERVYIPQMFVTRPTALPAPLFDEPPPR